MLYGETEVESPCQRFNIVNPRAVIRAYRKYRDSDGNDTPDELLGLHVAVNSIPIASAECERGFSPMNLICTPNRASALTSTISSLLFLNLVGPPLAKKSGHVRCVELNMVSISSINRPPCQSLNNNNGRFVLFIVISDFFYVLQVRRPVEKWIANCVL